MKIPGVYNFIALYILSVVLLIRLQFACCSEKYMRNMENEILLLDSGMMSDYTTLCKGENMKPKTRTWGKSDIKPNFSASQIKKKSSPILNFILSIELIFRLAKLEFLNVYLIFYINLKCHIG